MWRARPIWYVIAILLYLEWLNIRFGRLKRNMLPSCINIPAYCDHLVVMQQERGHHLKVAPTTTPTLVCCLAFEVVNMSCT